VCDGTIIYNNPVHTSNICAALRQISFISRVGFSACISSRNLIIANFSRKLTLLFILNLKVIAASVAQAPYVKMGDI
jgi:hypothetical protein